MNKRLQHLDIAKGLLITCLCFHHISQAFRINEITDVVLWPNASFAWYTIYFMQAFFLITGFSTNFNKPFKHFLKNNFKTLVIPSIAITITRRIFLYSVYGIPDQNLLQRMYLEWFLITLFFCKIILWGIVNCHKDRRLIYVFGGGISLIMLILGTFNLLEQEYSQWLYYKNICVMFVFLYIGWIIKQYKSNLKNFQLIGCGVFILLQIIHYAKGVNYPSVTAQASLQTEQIPKYLVVAFCGSMFILQISKVFEKYGCSLLQDIGKHSLVIYGFHYIYVRLAVLLLLKLNILYLDTNLRIGVSYLIIGTFTLVLSYLTSKLIDKYKYLSFYTGKW